ncbi:MAG: DNA alkylation repair protein [Candidatus Peribacteria bacterium]|jgi:3-methyladenine DNA glycosylase AlkD|nr:DNA alkylation repair protein [Candidatus Peribacteria bacterium]
MKNKVITNFMQNIRKKLLELSKGNEEYAIFNKKIVNTKKEVLGVRSPDMRKFAKDLAKEMNFEKLEDFLKSINENIFEEVCLFGFLVAYTKISDIEKIKLTKKYLKYVDNWALIDSFVSSFKRIDKDLW